MFKTPVALLLATIAVAGCENAHSRLDGVQTAAPAPAKAAPAQPGVSPVSSQADHSGDTETRLRRLEDNYAKYAEALDFLGKVYAQQKAQQAQQEAQEPDPTAVFAVGIKDDVALGKVDGPASAPVTIVKAFDFACPYCERAAGTMDELVKDYGGKVRVVYKDMVVHPQVATPAHLAACAAAKQGKYVPFKTAVWEKGFKPYAAARDASKLGKDNLMVIAKEVGLDMTKLEADMNGAECQQVVQADMAELAKFQVNSTPTFFINGIHVGGALPKEEFKKIIDERLKVAEASGVPGPEYYEKEVVGKGVPQFRSRAEAGPH
jgi:protein-disulfide isomerase